jgi:hypothetical protein
MSIDKNHQIRAFYYFPKSAPSDPPEIFFGIYAPNGGLLDGGECCMRWLELSGQLTPRLHAYDDSWRVLASFSDDLLQRLAEVDDKNISPEQFIEILKSCGFVDQTHDLS